MAPPALHTEFLTVGSGVSGYLAKPSGVPGIGVVVLMEAFGLNLGVLNFGFAEDRISARALTAARLLGIASSAAFL